MVEIRKSNVSTKYAHMILLNNATLCSSRQKRRHAPKGVLWGGLGFFWNVAAAVRTLLQEVWKSDDSIGISRPNVYSCVWSHLTTQDMQYTGWYLAIRCPKITFLKMTPGVSVLILMGRGKKLAYSMNHNRHLVHLMPYFWPWLTFVLCSKRPQPNLCMS